MTQVRIGTFNCENLFARYDFLDKPFEGSRYVDFIRPTAEDGLVGFYPGREDRPLPKEIGRQQRKNTAAVILHNKPDIVAVQEVENLPTMRIFNSGFLKRRFKYAVLIDGNDHLRLIDVGLYSNYPILALRTHMFDETVIPGNKDESSVFSRDCLEVDIGIDGRTVTFLVNHFKAQEPGTKRGPVPSKDVNKRRAQAERIADIVQEKFSVDSAAGYIVLGDLNCPPPTDGGTELEPLYDSEALRAVVDSKDGEKWTHFLSGERPEVSKLDHVFLSPALADANPAAKLLIERGGLSPECTFYAGERFSGVEKDTEASDHCGVFLDLEL
jgi:endonuclease/exonuclease/phosphatase family metal-dependent hydrolase